MAVYFWKMHFRKLSTIGLLLSMSFTCSWAQTYVYKSLRAQGSMPDDFSKSKTDLFLDEQEQISTDQKKSDYESEKDFILYSVFSISKLMKSGSVLYNDELTDYVIKVADKVLHDEPELRQRLRFYTLRSPEINAFSTQQGIIFITTGLLSQLENEAQLAFVLAHEVSHFERSHNLESFKERKKLSKGYLDPDEKLSSYFSYRQENELQADEDGVKRFLKTEYSTAAINTAFNVLLYSYLPFDERPFPYTWIEKAEVPFPAGLRMKELNEISDFEDVDDELSSHPNIKKRKQNVENLLPSSPVGKEYLVSEESFKYLQRLCRYAITDQLLKTAQYARAFYNAYLIEQVYHDTLYSKKFAAMAMYGLAKFKIDGSASKTYSNYKKLEGESQRVHHLFTKLDKKAAAVLAVKMCWEYHLAYPEDALMKRIANHSLAMLGQVNIPKNQLQTQNPGEEKEPLLTEDEINKLTKYEKIEYKKKVQARTDSEKKFYLFYLVDLMNNKSFASALNQSYDGVKAKTVEEEEDEESEDAEDKAPTETAKIETGIDQGRGKPKMEEDKDLVKLSRAMMLSPRYDLMDERGITSFREMMLKTDRREQELNQYYKELSSNLNLDLELIDDHKLWDTERFNDYCLLIDWLREKVQTEDIDMVSFSSLQMDEIRKKYQTDHLLITTMDEYIEPKEFNISSLFFSLIFYPVLPFYIYKQFQPEVSFERTTLVLDMATGKVNYSSNRTIESKYRKDLIRSGIYYELQKLSK